MTTNRVVTELIIDARGAAAGSAEFQRRMDAAQQAVDRMIEREQKLNNTTQQTGQALERGAASVAKRARQWDALAASLDPVVAAEQRAAKAIREATQVADAGQRLLGRSQQEASAMVAEVTRREMAKVEAIKKGVQATDQLTKSSGLARHEMINLSRQAQDVAVSLASGQSPFTVLLQQGTQVADVFASSGNGTVGGFFRQLGSGIASVVTPARLAGGAIVASAGLAVFALNRWNDAQIALNRSLYGTGLSAGVTRQQLSDLADAAARASNVAASAARETIAALAAAGRIDPRLLAPITAQAKGIGATTGLDEVETNKLLAASFAEPISGYKRMTDALGGYNIQVEDHIKRLVTQGKLYEAQQVLLQQIPSRLAPINEVTNQWARAWNAVSRGIKETLDDIAKLTGGPLGRFMDKWLETQRRVQEAGGGERGLRRVAMQDNAQAAVTDLQNKIKEAETRLAQLQSEAAGANDIGRPYLQRRVRNVQAEIERYKTELTAATREADRIDTGMRQIAQRTQQRTQQTQEQTTAQREREAAAQGVARLDQAFADTQRTATTATDARAQAEAKLREEMERRVFGQNQATAAARQMGAADAQGLNDVRKQIDQYNQLTDTIRGMLVERSRNPGLAQNEQWKAQLEELARTQMAARAAIEGRFSGRGSGMFGPNGRFDAPDDEVIARYKRLADVTRDQTQADVEAINARDQNQRIAAAQNQERIRMDQEGIAAGDAAAQAERQRGVAARIVAQDTRQLTDAERERRLATDATVEGIRAETAAMGGSIAQQEAVRARTQMAADARREYIRLFGENARVPQSELDAIDEMARRMGNARQQAAELKAVRDILFERQMIGLGDAEAQIARNLRQIYGDDGWRQQMDGTLAQQARFNNNLKEANDLAKGFGSDLLSALKSGKSGFDALIDAAGKFAAKLADKGMDRFIDMMLSGQNPMSFSGTLGGVFGSGGLAGVSPTRFGGIVQTSVTAGAADGIKAAFKGLGESGESGAGFNLSQGVGAGLQIGGAALGTYAAGQQGGPIAGALTGAMAGFQLGGPIGAAIGGLLGAISGAFRGNPQRDQAATQWRINKPETDLYISQLRGEVAGSMATSFAQETKKVLALSNEASMAREGQATWKAMEDALWKFKIDTAMRFVEPLDNMLVALESGLGSNSPIAQAHQTVRTLREEMLKFVSDAKTVRETVGVDAVEKAQKAAQAYALSLLTGAEEQTSVRQEFDRINQTAISLQSVLVDLGMSAAEAATAIADRLTKALENLKTKTIDDLTRRFQSASGVGYLNDVADALKQWDKDLSDANLLGIDKALVDRTNLAEIQKIITGAKLTDEAFTALIAKFPELEGAVTRAASTLTDIIERRLGYLDRYFNATNDSTTLEGQLRAFERNAAREREEEIKAGGEAMAELEMAIAAERLKVIRDFQTQQDRVLEQAQESYLSFVRRIKEYTDGLRAGAQSPLSPQARLSAAQSQYNAQLALAQGGNRDALNGITSYASDLLEAAKAYYASSTAFQTIWGSTINQLEALPTQVSAEQFIVNAINSASTANVSAIELMRTTLTTATNSGSASAIAVALSSFFSMLDTSVNGVLDFNEFQAGLNAQGLAKNTNLLQIFNELDTNGDAQLQKDELIRLATLDVKTNTNTTAGNTGTTASNTNATTNAVGAGNLIAQQISSLQSTATQQLQLLNANFGPSTGTYGPFNFGNAGGSNVVVTMSGGALEYLRKIVFNTYAISRNTFGINSNAVSSLIGIYAKGGWVGGNLHSAGGTMIEAERGEFVINRGAASNLAPFMEDINRGRLPVVPLPVAGNDNREVVRELRELRREVTQLREQVAHHAAVDAAGHARTASAAEETSNKVSQSTAEMRQAANRPRTAGRY